jgi:hypothetical protein
LFLSGLAQVVQEIIGEDPCIRGQLEVLDKIFFIDDNAVAAFLRLSCSSAFDLCFLGEIFGEECLNNVDSTVFIKFRIRADEVTTTTEWTSS